MGKNKIPICRRRDVKMKERSFIGSLGILLYVVLSLIDRFFYKIPDYIYIPLMVLGIVIIIVGFVIDKKNNKKYSQELHLVIS